MFHFAIVTHSYHTKGDIENYHYQEILDYFSSPYVIDFLKKKIYKIKVILYDLYLDGHEGSIPEWNVYQFNMI